MEKFETLKLLKKKNQVEEYQDRGAEGELDEGPERGGMEATGENLDGSRV